MLPYLSKIDALIPEELIIKNPVTWLDDSTLGQNLWIRIFLDMGFAKENKELMFFILGYFQ